MKLILTFFTSLVFTFGLFAQDSHDLWLQENESLIFRKLA